MICMFKLLRNFLIIFAFLFLFSFFTNSFEKLLNANFYFLFFAVLSYLISIIVWIFAWSLLIKSKYKLSFRKLFNIGFSSIVGSFTPVQLGVEALRVLQLKKSGVSIKDSIGASMLVKGSKFLIILLLAIFFSQPLLNSNYFFWILAGLFVIFLATLLFLLPLIPFLGYKISKLFLSLSKIKYLNFLKKLSEYFLFYTDYLKNSANSLILIIFFLSTISWIFELLSLVFSFYSVGLLLKINILIYAAALISILERIPFLPRGIGLLEIICFYFFRTLNLKASIIGAALVIFTFSRLIFPVLLSLIFNIRREQA